MDTEKLFDQAVRLVEANIRAGQYLNGENFDTIIRGHTILAFDALLAAWMYVNEKDDDPRH